MKKNYLFLVLTFIPIILFGQTEPDRDADGVIDKIEDKIFDHYSVKNGYKGYNTFFNPSIAEIPSVSIAITGSVDIGLELNLSESNEGNIYIKHENSSSLENIKITKSHMSSTVKNKLELESSSDLKTGAIFSSLTLKNSFSFETSSGVDFTLEEIDKWKKEYYKSISSSQNTSLKFNDKAGYIKANITFFNTSKHHEITISKVILRVYSYDIVRGIRDDKPLFMPIEVNLKAKGAKESQNNELTLDKGGFKERLIEISEINSYEMIKLIENKKSIVFVIESYEVSLNNDLIPREISLAGQKSSLSRETFKLRVFDGENDITYYVANKTSDGKFMTLKKALIELYGSNIQFDVTTIKKKPVTYIKKLNSHESNAAFAKKVDFNYQESDLIKGFWYKLINNGITYTGDIDAPINEPGVEISLIYLTGKDLVRTPKEAGSISLEVKEDTPIPTGLFVGKNNKVKIDIVPYLIKYTQNYNNGVFTRVYPPAEQVPYKLATISEEWVYQKLNKSDITNINLLFKFKDYDKVFHLSDFKNLKVTAISNGWSIELEMPSEMKSSKNHEFIILPQLNNYSDSSCHIPIQMYEGILSENMANLNTALNTTIRHTDCKFYFYDGVNPCELLRNFIHQNQYRSKVMYPKIYYSLNISLFK